MFMFVKIRHVRTKATYTQTEMDKPFAIGEILQIFPKTSKLFSYLKVCGLLSVYSADKSADTLIRDSLRKSLCFS